MEQKVVDTTKPLYIQIKETILQQIKDKKLAPGDKLLSEAQFQKEFQVSRITVRKAIDELVTEGYVTRLQGKGSFVKRQNSGHQKTLSLTQVCQEQGKKLTSDVLFADKVAVPRAFADLFTEDKVIEIQRMRKIDGVPIMLEKTYFPAAFAFLLENDLSESLYRILEEHKIEPDYKGLNQVTICQLNDEEAKLFNVQSGISVIHHTGTVYDAANQLVLASEELVRVDLPDLFKYYL